MKLCSVLMNPTEEVGTARYGQDMGKQALFTYMPSNYVVFSEMFYLFISF